MESKRLSVCIIAKNEAENIGRCINSVGVLADEIIVLDTGSKDGTPEIACSLGAKVITTQWEDDFSKARNLSLEHAEGEWVLVLDCDEELDPNSKNELEKILEIEGPEAYFLQIVNTTAEGMELIVPGLRLFRNRKEYRFEGRIHEQILAAIGQHCNQNQILQSSVSIIHHGYDHHLADIPAKIHRNMRILESIPEDKRDGFYFYNLGTEYLRYGQREEALKHFLKAAPLTHPGQGYGPIMIKRIITLLFELGKYRQALHNLEHYQSIYNDFTDLVLLTGVCHFICGRYSEAKKIIKQYLDMPPAPHWYPMERSVLNQSPEMLLEIAGQHAVVRDYDPLSVCIIGNNEAANLARCIKSVNEIAAQVIYIDTGSSDNSLEIASELGAEIHSITWKNDFAFTRNYALEQVRGDWVLVLDADEVLLESSVPAVIRAIKGKSSPAYLVKIHTPLDKSSSALNSQLSGRVRVFRSGARYQGALADELFFEGPDFQPEPIPDLEIMHFHFQYPPMQIIDKAKTWEDIILLAFPDESPMRYFMLGSEAFYAQDPHKAIAYLKESFELGLKDNSAAYYYLILSLTNIGEYDSAIRIAEKAQTVFPDYTDLFYLKAMAHGLVGQLREAEVLLLQCLQMGGSAWWKYLSSPGTGHFKALLSLGAVYARQGKLGEAIDVFIQAAKLPQSTEQAIEHLVALQGVANFQIETLLRDQGLVDWRNLAIVAQTYVKMEKRIESWECLRCLDEQEVTDQQECLNRMIIIMETHLFNIKRQLVKYIPDHLILKYI